MVSEWAKKAREKLKEYESNACSTYVKNLPLTEKEKEIAMKTCITNLE